MFGISQAIPQFLPMLSLVAAEVDYWDDGALQGLKIFQIIVY